MPTTENDARCPWCGEPATNCPNRDGECCCLPCYDLSHLALTHATRPTPPGEGNPNG